MAVDNAAATGMSVTVTTLMMSGFSTFLPPLREIRQASKTDDTMRNDVRNGQVAAAILALGVGVLMSWLSQSPMPLYVGIAATLLYATIYELALRDERA